MIYVLQQGHIEHRSMTLKQISFHVLSLALEVLCD